MPSTESILYHNPRCSKSRAALALLQARGIAVRVVDYIKTPPTQAELADLLDRLGLPAGALLRRKEAAAAEIDPAGSAAAVIAALARHPEALERPIFVHRGRAALGRPPENVLEIL